MLNKSNSLLEQYLKLCPNLQIVYVIPMIISEPGSNDYLKLLYQPFLKHEKQLGFTIRGVSVSQYPRICFKRLKGERSILHMHWYDFNSLRKLLFLIWRTWWMLVYRLLGGKIVWTVHNKYPHSNRYRLLNKILRFFMARIANVLHVHCNEAINIMSKVFRLRKQKFFVYPHPMPKAKFMDKKAAQQELSKMYTEISFRESEIVFLMFGLIAEYKGINEVVELFSRFDKNVKLIIAGKTRPMEEKYSQTIAKKIKNVKHIIFINEPIPSNLVPLFFNSCDAVILNYKDILTSGVYYLALSYKKYILATAKGCLQEADNNLTFLYSNIEELHKHIEYIIKFLTPESIYSPS